MLIRPFDRADHDAVQRLWEASAGLGTVSRDEIDTKLERDPDLFLVGEDDGLVTAVVMGSYDGRRGWIFRLAVDPERRRAGVARELVEALEQRMLERGIDKVRLLVMRDNAPGHAFWEAVGYERDDDVVFYGKDLSGGSDTSC